MMTLKRTVAPSGLPVDVDEAKSFLNVTDNAETASIRFFLESAVGQLDGADGILNRALLTQTWEMKMSRFPVYGRIIPLPLPPLVSVTSIAYVDSAGNAQTWASSNYNVRGAAVTSRRGYIELGYDKSWPETRDIEEAVTITFVAGYGAASAVPADIKHLILFVMKEGYDCRNPVSETELMRSPSFRGLLAKCRFPVVA